MRVFEACVSTISVYDFVFITQEETWEIHSEHSTLIPLIQLTRSAVVKYHIAIKISHHSSKELYDYATIGLLVTVTTVVSCEYLSGVRQRIGTYLFEVTTSLLNIFSLSTLLRLCCSLSYFYIIGKYDHSLATFHPGYFMIMNT